MNRTILATIIAVLVMGGGFLLLNKSNDDKVANSTTSNTTQDTQTPASTDTPDTKNDQQTLATITYTDNGFSEKTVTVKSGDTVTVTNTSGRSLQFASDPHPQHTDNADINVGIISAGQSMTFVANTKGTFGFHNHINANHIGKITVQ